MSPLRILIVDDTIVYRSILRGVVDALPDCTVVGTASDGAMALDRLAQAPADLVLLDVEMPVMGGLETLTAIRQRYPDTGVIMVSGVNQNAANITFVHFNRARSNSFPSRSRRIRQTAVRRWSINLDSISRRFGRARDIQVRRPRQRWPHPLQGLSCLPSHSHRQEIAPRASMWSR